MFKKIVIIGCGKSGTKYIQKVLKRADIHIGHEYKSKDGLSSWYATPTEFDKDIHLPYHASQLKGYDPLHTVVLHQVRHPLNTIISFKTNCSRPSWEYVYKHIPEIDHEKDSPLLQTMKYWYYWNQIAENKAEWTYTVEGLFKNESMFTEFCKRIGQTRLLPLRDTLGTVSQLINTGGRSRYKNITWEHLFNEDFNLTKKIIKRGRRYGYDL